MSASKPSKPSPSRSTSAMNQPAAPRPSPSPEQASQIVDQGLQLLENLLARWMSTPASTFQEQALRSLLPQFLPSLQAELRKSPAATVQVLAFVHQALGELLAVDAPQLLLPELARLASGNNGTAST